MNKDFAEQGRRLPDDGTTVPRANGPPAAHAAGRPDGTESDGALYFTLTAVFVAPSVFVITMVTAPDLMSSGSRMYIRLSEGTE